MSNEELRHSIERLRSEIDRVDGDNESIKARVGPLITDLEHQLDNPQDSEHKDTLIHGLHELIEQFEVEHPHVTNIVNHITITLGNMGI